MAESGHPWFTICLPGTRYRLSRKPPNEKHVGVTQGRFRPAGNRMSHLVSSTPMFTRFFPSLALAAFAFGIVHGGHAAAQPVSFSDGPLLLQLMAPNRLGIARPAPQPASFSPATMAPQRRQPTADPRYGRPTDPAFLPREVPFETSQPKGTIIIDTVARYLYLVEGDGMAKRYGVGVGRPGFEWAGTHTITRKAKWPDWTPPEEMRQRVQNLPVKMDGGVSNPLGARALYLGSTLYRIHGSNEPWTIGHAVSSGCIRMRNDDVVDLYDRVKVGTKVVVK
jgi:lipoprotein-anchoring transpeptidase ErfK/SrfK